MRPRVFIRTDRGRLTPRQADDRRTDRGAADLSSDRDEQDQCEIAPHRASLQQTDVLRSPVTAKNSGRNRTVVTPRVLVTTASRTSIARHDRAGQNAPNRA
jgi:hypothetical protein